MQRKRKKCRKHKWVPGQAGTLTYFRKDGSPVVLTEFRCTVCGHRSYQNSRGRMQPKPGC